MSVRATLQRVIKISLTPDEQIIVETIATNRHTINQANNIEEHLQAKRDPLDNLIEAVGAEFAVCKHYNVYPDLQWSTMNNFDLKIKGHRVDVKKVFGEFMNIRKTFRSQDVDYYIGVGGSFPDYTIIGTLSAERVHGYDLRRRNSTEYWSVPCDHLLS